MADAPLLLDTDYLDEAYPKINQAIKKANSASSNSETSLYKANQAIEEAKATQQQVNQIIVEGGTSDEETMQARGSYELLYQRLDGNDVFVSIDDFPRLSSETNDQPRLQRFADFLEQYPTKTGFVKAGEFVLNSPWLIGDNTSIILDYNTVIIRNHSMGGSAGGTIRNKKLSSTNRNTNIKITGGKIKANDETKTGKHLVFWGVDNLKLYDITIRDVHGDWSTLFRDCNDVTGDNFDIDTVTDEEFTDGIHVLGGSGYLFQNCNIKSGDDCLSFTVETAEDTDIDGITISNCVLTTRRSSIIKMTTKTGTTATIKTIKISNVIGKGGTENAGEGIVIKDESNIGRISEITLNDVTVDSSQGAGVGFRLQGTNQVEGDISISKPQGKGADLSYCKDIELKIRVDSPRTAGISGIGLGNIDEFKLVPIVINATLHGVAVGATGAPVTNGKIYNGKVKGSLNTDIRLINAVGVDVKDNRLSGANGVIEDTVSDWNIIDGNDVRSVQSTKLSINGANTRIGRSNKGFRSFNSGTSGIPVGETSVKVPHGLAAAPNVANIKLTNINSLGNATKLWVDQSSITNTEFTVRANVDPALGLAQFGWDALIPKSI